MAIIIADRSTTYVKAILTGAPGGGKSWTALNLASYLASHGEPPSPSLAKKVCLIESENRGREYAGGRPFYFSIEELTNFSPDDWMRSIQEAKRLGFTALVLDSLSDEWRGRGGCSALAEEKGGTYAAWGHVKLQHWRLIEAIQDYPGHVLVTVRSKPGIDLEIVNGKRVPVARGLEPIQEDGFCYRLSHSWDMVSIEGRGAVLKVRKSVAPSIPMEGEYEKPGREFAQLLLDWCRVDNEKPSASAGFRDRFAAAGSKEEVGQIGLEVKASMDKLTQREVVWLRELATQRLVEISQQERGIAD